MSRYVSKHCELKLCDYFLICQVKHVYQQHVLVEKFDILFHTYLSGGHTCDTSRIMQEAPGFEPNIPHSGTGNAISRIMNFAIMIFSQADGHSAL